MLLAEDSQTPDISLVIKGERPLITRDGTRFGYLYEAAADKFVSKKMEPFILTLPVNQKKSVYQHEGREILFVPERMMRFCQQLIKHS